MNARIYLSSPHMSDEGFEKEYIEEAFDTNWIAPLGNKEGALSSSTAAIHMALKAAGVTTGDIVLYQIL